MAKLSGFDKVAVITMGCYNKDYYYALYDENIVAGDTVLVSGVATGSYYIVKEVITLEEAYKRTNKDITAEVIAKIDVTAYEKRVTDRIEKEKIKKRMNTIIKQMDETKKYEAYAMDNPELAELLEKFKGLKG